MTETTNSPIDKRYAVLTETNQVLRIGIMQPAENEIYVEIPMDIVIPTSTNSASRLYYIDGEFIYTDDRSINDAKIHKNNYINESKILANQSFTYSGKQIQADESSWKEIVGTHGWITATQSMPPGFPMQWKALDNTYVPITTVAEWLQFYGAALQRGVINFQRAQELKQQLAAATTLEEIDNISW